MRNLFASAKGVFVTEVDIRGGAEVFGLSDQGQKRQNNEDSYAYGEGASAEEFERRGRAIIVADGMGGHQGGGEASDIAVKAVKEAYFKPGDTTPSEALIAGFQTAHERILEYARIHPELEGMGTTCTVAAVLGSSLYYAHCGDCRLYLMHQGSLRCVSRDHSFVGQLVESGAITADEAAVHPQRHILSAALGSGLEVSADVSSAPMKLEVGDIVMICSDGLWGQFKDEEILAALTSKPLKAACHWLVDEANSRGGPDNITLMALRVTE